MTSGRDSTEIRWGISAGEDFERKRDEINLLGSKIEDMFEFAIAVYYEPYCVA